MSRDSTQLLAMALVLGGTELEPSTEILYSDYIDSASVTTAFNSLVELGAEGGLCKNASTLITDNDSLMSKTNSDRFYNGSDAQKHFGNMKTIGFRFDSIADYVNTSEELSLMESGIKQYNEKLTKLKANCRKKLLQNEADKFNEAKHEWEGYPVTKVYKYTSYDSYALNNPTEDSSVDFCCGDNSEQYEWELTNSSSNEVNLKDDTGYVYQTYYEYTDTYVVHKYKYIKHWNFFKNWDTWFDPDISEIEALFAKVGADLPYDPALIVGPDAE